MSDGRRVDREAAERLGRNLFMARRRAGFSQEELGSLACLHRTEIGFIEGGRRLPRVDTLGKLASAWHTDLDLGREIEAVTDMTKSRLAGFHDYQPTPGSFLDLFARLRRERIIPDAGR